MKPSQPRVQRGCYEIGDEPVPGYRLIAWLGQGGMGEVWKATSPGGIDVALKIIDGLDLRAGRKEFRSLQLVKNIKHPNLVPILAFWLKGENGEILDVARSEPADVDSAGAADQTVLDDRKVDTRKTLDARSADTDLTEADDQPDSHKPAGTDQAPTVFARPAQLIIAMGLGEKSLYNRLEECLELGQQGIPVAELLDYLDVSAKAIDLLNTKYQIQHCNIKPQNILIVGNSAQVCDFGLAKNLTDVRQSTTGACTIAYGAPERMRSRKGSKKPGQPTSTTDQYSLAISYFELRTGKLPFRDTSIMAVIEDKQKGNLELSRVPARERVVIAKATALQPEQRYNNCREMLQALRQAIEVPADPLALMLRRSTPSRRGARLLGAFAVLAITVAAGIVVCHSLGSTAGSPNQPAVPGLTVGEVDRQFSELLAEQQFEQAVKWVIKFPEERRAEVHDVIRRTWLQLATSQFDGGNTDQAWKTCTALLKQYSDDQGGLALRRRMLGSLIDEAEGFLSKDYATRAERSFDQLLTRLSPANFGDDRAIERRVRLGMARAIARQGIPRWSEVVAILQSLAKFEQPLKDLQSWPREQQAQFLVLWILDKADGEAAEVLPRLDALAADDLMLNLRGWELDSIERLKERLLVEMEKLPALTEEQQQWVSHIWSNDKQFNLLLAHAREKLASGDFAGSLRDVEQAAPLALRPDAHSSLIRLRANVVLADPSSTGEALLARLREVAAEQDLSELHEFCAPLVKRVQLNPQFAADVLDIFDQVRPRLSIADRTSLDAELAELVILRIAATLNGAAYDMPVDFVRMLSDCQRVPGTKANAVTRASTAECLMETSGGRLDYTTWSQSESLVRQLPPSAEHDPLDGYLNYVQALVAYRNPLGRNLEVALSHIREVFSRRPVSLALRAPQRRHNAALILLEAAKQMRGAGDQQFEQAPYSSAAKAGEALALLKLAHTLLLAHKPVPQSDELLHADLETNLALALFYAQPALEDQALVLADSLCSRETNPPGQVLLISALIHKSRNQPADRKLAIQRFAQLIDMWSDRSQQSTGSDLPVYQRIVAPALDVADQFARPFDRRPGDSADDVVADLAKIYAAKGRFIQRDVAVAEQFAERANDEAYEAFRVANSFHAQQD